MLWKSLFSIQSRSGNAAKLSTLIFHRVLAEPDPLFPDEVDAARFDQILGWLKSWFKVLPLDEAQRLLAEGRLPSRAAAISFDDGYADNATLAVPLLRRHGLSASFFIATGFLDGGCMWNDVVIETLRRSTRESLDLSAIDPVLPREPLSLQGVAQRRSAIDAVLNAIKYLPIEHRLRLVASIAAAGGVEPPRDLMLSSDQVRGMHRDGMGIGAHTISHPILATLDEATARHEILESRRVLEDITASRIGLFAYPNGKPGRDYDARSVNIVREAGFDAAVSTAFGVSTRDTDRFQLPRFTPWDASRNRFAARLAQNLTRRETWPALLEA